MAYFMHRNSYSCIIVFFTCKNCKHNTVIMRCCRSIPTHARHRVNPYCKWHVIRPRTAVKLFQSCKSRICFRTILSKRRKLHLEHSAVLLPDDLIIYWLSPGQDALQQKHLFIRQNTGYTVIETMQAVCLHCSDLYKVVYVFGFYSLRWYLSQSIIGLQAQGRERLAHIAQGSRIRTLYIITNILLKC